MTYFMMFILVLITLIALRTINIVYKSKRKKRSNLGIVIKHILRFILKELKLLVSLYIAMVGIYILIERMYKYNIYPASIKNVKENILIIHEMNTNHVILQMYMLVISFYIMFLLPYKLLNIYGRIIKETNSKDYLQFHLTNLFNKIKNTINKTSHTKE